LFRPCLLLPDLSLTEVFGVVSGRRTGVASPRPQHQHQHQPVVVPAHCGRALSGPNLHLFTFSKVLLLLLLL
jgi:hypothetical protein